MENKPANSSLCLMMPCLAALLDSHLAVIHARDWSLKDIGMLFVTALLAGAALLIIGLIVQIIVFIFLMLITLIDGIVKIIKKAVKKVSQGRPAKAENSTSQQAAGSPPRQGIQLEKGEKTGKQGGRVDAKAP